MKLLVRYFKHPVMGLMGAMLIAVMVLSIGLLFTSGKQYGLLASQIGTVLVVFGFFFYMLYDIAKRRMKL